MKSEYEVCDQKNIFWGVSELAPKMSGVHGMGEKVSPS